MSQEQWTAVDRYITNQLLPRDDALEGALKASVDAGLPAIAVSPNQGKLLHLLPRISGPRNFLEIGPPGGNTTIGPARPLPKDGRLIPLEPERDPPKVASANTARARLSDKVELILG